eukprot:gene7174-7937_t
MARRVVLTGSGLVTPLGCGKGQTIFHHLIHGQSGIHPLTATGSTDPSLLNLTTPPSSPLNVTHIGKVPKGDQKEEYSDLQHRNRNETSLFIRYALTASQYALEDAKITNFNDSSYDLTRCGVAIGNGGIGAINEITQTFTQFTQQSYRKVSPYFVPKILVNMAAGHVSITYGLQGPVHCVTTACAAGLHSIGDAYHFIKFGMADLMLAGGSDASIDPLSLAGFNRMKALSNPPSSSSSSTTSSSTGDAADHYLASRPFDIDRNGFVMAEGAGVVVLEELEHALRRDAPIIAEVVGYGLSGDAYHATSPSPEGNGARLSMRNALNSAGLTMAEVDYVHAHATSTPVGDAIEIRAIGSLLEEANAKGGGGGGGGDGHRCYVSSTKGHMGHLLGAAGAVELAVAALGLQSSILPATLNLVNIDPNCCHDLVEHIPQKALDFKAKHGRDVNIVLKNSFGFGGTNASIVLKRW